jgi:F-type H+-transporting ATPase subunit epsilon
MSTLKCVVVTPEATSVEQEADFVVVPLFDGEKGIAAGHSPMIGRLGFGELRLKHGGTIDHYYVDGGFVQVEDNVVSVITGRVLPAAKLDAKSAGDQLRDAAKRPAHTPELLDIRDRAVDQARAQLRLAQKSQRS